MKEAEWLMQDLEVSNVLDDEYSFDQHGMEVGNEERTEWTIEPEGFLEQRYKGKIIGCTQATPNRPSWLEYMTCIKKL